MCFELLFYEVNNFDIDFELKKTPPTFVTFFILFLMPVTIIGLMGNLEIGMKGKSQKIPNTGYFIPVYDNLFLRVLN